MAGFVAATWLRGVEVVGVPTTLVGAVDAAIGGKTGINLRGKNLVGAFWHPSRVLVDLDVLEALPDRLRREGLAEALKAGLVGDPGLVERLEAAGLETPLEEVVGAAVAVKVAVVTEDPEEARGRAVLNYGHTIGHAIEMAAGIPHGEAIAIGMVAAGAVAERLTGFTQADRQRRIIEGLGLPVAAPPLDRKAVSDLLRLDKKARGDQLRMVLLRDIGVPAVLSVDEADLAVAWAAVGV